MAKIERVAGVEAQQAAMLDKLSSELEEARREVHNASQERNNAYRELDFYIGDPNQDIDTGVQLRQAYDAACRRFTNAENKVSDLREAMRLSYLPLD